MKHNETKEPQRPTSIAQLNTNIEKEIQNHKQAQWKYHKQALWKQHITNNWDHKINTHALRKTLNDLAHKKTPQTPNITFDNKTAITDKQEGEHFN